MARFYLKSGGKKVLYDTATAQRVATWENEETLYRKHTGEFFLHIAINGGKGYVVPLTLYAARKWIVEKFGYAEGMKLLDSAFDVQARLRFTGKIARRLNILSSALAMSKSSLVSEAINKLWTDSGLAREFDESR